MIDPLKTPYENYKKYKRGEAIMAWIVSIIVIIGVVIAILPKKRYPQTDANGNTVIKVCTNDFTKIQDFPPPMETLCVSKH